MASLRYPNEIVYETTDWFSVGISSYSAGDILGSGAAGISTSAGLVNNVSASIILPMPSNIQDGNSVAYDENSMNPLTAAGLNAVSNIMSADYGFNNGSVSNVSESIGKIIKKFETETRGAFNQIGSNNAKNLIMKGLAAEAISVFGGNVSLNSFLARESGQILNPNMELLFSGVTLRTFRFSFKMTPRDNTESENIRMIIYTLKKNMAPRNGTTFLGTPNVFTLAYKKGNQPHPFLHKFKPCFLKDMAVNYTGENTYVTYSDGTPISMTMDLTFQEMFPIYDNDYSGFVASSATQGVGY